VTVVRLEAPAKVNLRLRIMAREDSGYHQLETVFAALDFGDVVEVTPAGAGVTLEVSGPSPCPPEDNLAYRAALAYMEAAGIAQGARIHLEKRIPAAGGLGGGSSDAAAVLRALDWMYEGELGVVRLARLGSDLGADVPFFLSPSPVALAWGRGDRFLPLPPLPEAYLLLCVPEVSVSTAAAFQAMTAARAAAGSPGGRRRPGAHGSAPRRSAGVLAILGTPRGQRLPRAGVHHGAGARRAARGAPGDGAHDLLAGRERLDRLRALR
jgi:4-diphosphocytidyl-2-C-methyl-D-erythritol kinase